jgi:hypothetical protein
MLQNGTSLRKSAPGPPNMSDACVSCTARATRNASLQILFKRPTFAIVFSATKVSLWQWAESIAPATNNAHSTSKSGAKVVCFNYQTEFSQLIDGFTFRFF